MTDVDVILKRFEEPDEVREFELGRFEIVTLGGMTIGRATYQPGWKWSVHVGAPLGQASCRVEHVGMVVSGSATAAMDDGRVIEMRAGDARTAEDARDWAEMLMVNSISPYMLGKAFLRCMAENGKMIAISSGMGSIGGSGGGWIPYRTSKAALNMAWNSLALETRGRGIACILLSPGWVKTRMGGAGAEITPEESVSAMRSLIDQVTMEDTGRFLRRDGSEIPW